jgi:hypothetical protein
MCGTMQPNLPASTNTTKTGLTANGNGVLTIAPKNSSESGSNATLGKFVSGYKGLELTSSTLQYPGKPSTATARCVPRGRPTAGKPGVVIVDSWSNFESKGKGTETSGAPQDLLFANGQLITMAFVPATANGPQAPGPRRSPTDRGARVGSSPRPPPRPPRADHGHQPPPTPPRPDTPPATSPPTTSKSSGGSTK